MSAIFCDGFDTYASIYDKWTYVEVGAPAGDVAISTLQSRNGGQSVRFLSGTAYPVISRSLGAGAHATVFVHFAVRHSQYIGDEHVGFILTSTNDVTPQTLLAVYGGSSNGLIIRRGGRTGTIIASAAAGVVPLDTWTHVAWRSVLGITTGAATVWVNGNKVIDVTNINTQLTAGPTTYDRIQIFGQGGAGIQGQFIDDLVVLNAAGTINNAYLGNVQVATLRPNGAGDRTQLLPVGTANNWENVDETLRNDTDFNASPTDGAADLYAMDNLPAGVGVHFIQQTSYVRKSNPSAKSVAQIIKTNGTEYPQAAVALGTNFVPVSNIYETNPATSAGWNSTQINSSQAGVEVRP